MSRRYDHAMKKSRFRRRRDQLGKEFAPKSYIVFGSGEEGQSIGSREGGDGAPSPDVDRVAVQTLEWSGADLLLAIHSVPVGGKDKLAKIDEFDGITDRISKLLNDYDSLYADDETGQQATQQSMAGQMYMDTLLSDYNTLCNERELLLESLQDSLDMDEEDVLDALEKKAKESAVDIEGSENVVMETFQTAKVTFEKLKDINQNMVNMSKQGQDTTRLEDEKKKLEEELTMYKRMAVQQRMDNAVKTRRRASMARKDETQQWKLVAGEMLDIVKGIQKEGQYDKGELERELNNILITMSTQTETIEKLKLDLSTSEAKNASLEQDKVKLYRDMTDVQEAFDAKRSENNQLKRIVNQLKNKRKQEAEAAAAEAKTRSDQIGLEVTQEPDTRGTTPVATQDTVPTDLLQAQLRDQKNKVVKFEAQNKELLEKIETYEKEASKKRQQEINLAQKAMKESGKNACSNCQVLGAQVINGQDEMDQLSEKVSLLEKELASLREQLQQALEDHEKLKSHKETVKKPTKIPEIVTSKKSAPEKTKAKPTAAEKPQPITAKEDKKSSLAKDRHKLPALPPAPTTVHQAAKKVEIKETLKEESESENTESDEEQEDNSLNQTPTTITTTTTTTTTTTHKPKPKTVRKTSPTPSKKSKSPDKFFKLEETNQQEAEITVAKQSDHEVTEKLEDILEKAKKEELFVRESKKAKDEEFSSDEKAPYVKVREAKMMTLCDKGTQTGYHGRMASMNVVHRRESVGSWRSGRKHSLTDAIMSIAPPPVIEQETSVATNTIYEEVERLCEEVSNFVEYGFDLVQQSASTLHNQAEKHIGSEITKEIMKETEHDIPPSITDRRQSVSHGGGPGAGSRRRSSILQLDTRRGSIRNKESLFPPELLGRKRADTTPSMSEESVEKSDEHQQDDSAVFHNTLFPFHEMLLKDNISNVAQQALDIIKGTGEVFSTQLNFKLGVYDKFYDFWRRARQQRRQSLKNVSGKGVLPSMSFDKPERPQKIPEHHEEDEDKTEVEPGPLFPHIATSHTQTSNNKGKHISTANLTNDGIMMIGSLKKSTTTTTEKRGSPHSSAPTRKRVKPLTRQQQMAKQKALLDKVLHVDSRMQDIRNIVMGGAEQPAVGNFSRRVSMAIHGMADSPFIAHGITQSSQEGQRQDKKPDVHRRMSMIEEVQHSQTQSTWNVSQPISKYKSTSDVPVEHPLINKRRGKGRLPSLSLNVHNIFK